MLFIMGVLLKEVLSAPVSVREIRTLNVVILVVLLLSVIGAGWIILSFLVR